MKLKKKKEIKKKDLKITKENENNENIKKKYEKFNDSYDLNKQVKVLYKIENDLDISKTKNDKIIANIINNKIIRKREKSDNDDDDDDNDNKIKPEFKEFKVDYDDLNQSVIGKNAMTFLEKKQQKIYRNIYLSLLEMIIFIYIKV
jgi:hypothetical protein